MRPSSPWRRTTRSFGYLGWISVSIRTTRTAFDTRVLPRGGVTAGTICQPHPRVNGGRMSSELAGVVPITVTPFHEDGRMDEASIATLVEFEARCGVHGLNVLGIMGEAHKLGEGERRRVAELFLKHVAGRLPIVVGTSHGGTGVVVELSQAAEDAGAAAVMVAPPIGLRGDAAILAHYRQVAAAISIPIVVQDE